MAVFRLNTRGYDPFIDYLKGICIVCVVINHCMPIALINYSGFYFWGASAVPIFLLIQVFHAYKKGICRQSINWKRLWKKIFLPFLLCELIILADIIISSSHYDLSGIAACTLAMIKDGGYGPGAYYPWIYLQFAILLPLIAPAFRRRGIGLCIAFVILSQAVETACAWFGVPQMLYRLTFIRYIFLFYLGFLLASKSFAINTFTICAASICLLFSAFVVYSGIDFTPLFYPFVNPVCHWFCYVYIAWLLVLVLKYAYGHTQKEGTIMNFLLAAGKYSYEIYLFQMVYFVVANDFIFALLERHIASTTLQAALKTTIPVILCTLPVILYKQLRANTQKA